MVYVSNLGKDGEPVFLEKDDYIRFVFSLAYLNTDLSVGKAGNTRHIIKRGYRGFSPAPVENQRVGIVAFALMPGEFHLILRERKENGVSKFMQKISTGYSVYMNKKRGKSGKVFQGTYKTSVLESDEAVREAIRRVHLLPLTAVTAGAASEVALENPEESQKALEEYPWSSYPDYLGRRSLAFLDQESVPGFLPGVAPAQLS
jgi:putative transposase